MTSPSDAPILAKLEALPKAKVRNGKWSASCPARCTPMATGTHRSLGAEQDRRRTAPLPRRLLERVDRGRHRYDDGRPVPPKTNGAAAPARARRRPVARYDYRNADGSLAYYVERHADKVFPQYRPDGSPIGDTPRVPYRLPELLGSTKGVVIVEGEKDADRLASLGFVATTNSGGAGKWQPEISEHLRGRTVVVIARQRRARPQALPPMSRTSYGIAARGPAPRAARPTGEGRRVGLARRRALRSMSFGPRSWPRRCTSRRPRRRSPSR